MSLSFHFHSTAVCITVCCFFSSGLLAQYTEGLQQLNDKKFTEAKTAFDNAMQEDRVLGLLGMSKYYSHAGNPAFHLDSAYVIAVRAETQFKRLTEKEKSKLEKDLLDGSPIKNRRAIEKLCSEKALKENTLEGYIHYLDLVKKSNTPEAKTIEENRNKLAFEKASTIGSLEAFTNLFDQYGNSIKQKSVPIYRAASYKLFDLYTQANGWSANTRFKEKYPLAAWARDSTILAFENARKSKTNGLEVFIKKTTVTSFAQIALDTLSSRLLRRGNWNACIQYLKIWPEMPRKDSIWMRAYQNYRLSNPSPQQLQVFTRQNPGFPFPDLLKKDEALAVDFYFRATMNTDSLSRMKHFIKAYPNYPKIDSIWQKYVDNTLAKAKTLAEVDSLIYDPNCPKYLVDKCKSSRNTILDKLAKPESKALFATPYDKTKWPAYHRFIKKWAPSDPSFFALQRIMTEEVYAEKWAAVKDTINRYAEFFKEKNGQFDYIYKLIKEKGNLVIKKKVIFPDEGNYSEYSPFLSADGQQLFFCRKMGTGLQAEDIYVAKKTNTGWSNPKLIAEICAPDTNEAPECVSHSATEMLIFRSGVLCTSQKNATGWSAPLEFPSTINFTEWQGDGRYISNGMIYSAGNSINRDIYVALQDPEGKWMPPINLGTTINTSRFERTPFLHPDMKTLYFSSNGHIGFGNLDLYVSTRLDSSWTNWSEPKNLGILFNSSENDWDFKVMLGGKKGYMSIGSDGIDKIHFIDLPEWLRPDTIYSLEAKIVGEDGTPIIGELQAIDKKTGKVLQRSRPDPVDGKVVFALPTDQVKFIIVPDKSPPSTIQPVLTIAGSEDDIPTKNIKQFKIDERPDASIRDVLFATGSYAILPEAHTYLIQWAKFIQRNKLKIEIQGHTDNTSSTEFNQVLSENRAQAVRQFLIENNCIAENLTTRGFGESKPEASNATEEGRAKNRRVVMKQIQ